LGPIVQDHRVLVETWLQSPDNSGTDHHGVRAELEVR
jgi:hypothetical protein